VADTVTLAVNGVKGTSTSGNGASVKSMTSFTWAGNWTFGKRSGNSTQFSPGGVIDEIFVYEFVLSQQELTDLYESLVTVSPPPVGTRQQKGDKFQRTYKNPSGTVDDIKTLNSDVTVTQGGAIDWLVQMNCTGAACDAFGSRVYRSIDGGATYAQVNDLCGIICFRGVSSDDDLVTAATTGCLTGALTPVDGVTNSTSAAIPTITLAQNECTTIRYKFTIATDATIGQDIYLKLKDQNNNDFESSAEPTALGAKLTVVGPSAGIGY
jgi:hypothetical protein